MDTLWVGWLSGRVVLKHRLVNMPADPGTRCLARQCHARYSGGPMFGDLRKRGIYSEHLP